MSRLVATALLDIRLQYRNGFYFVSAFMAVATAVGLMQLPQVDWKLFWPAIILENLVVNAFYFMAALVLLEKAEGTLEAQVTTPLGPLEYLTAKVLTLGLLSSVESIAVVAAVSGLGFNWMLLLAGVLLLVAVYALYGFWVIARYDSITEFLLPSALWTIAFSLPLVHYFDIWRHPIMWLHPLQAPLVLMQAAFVGVPEWQVAYGLIYGLAWLGIAFTGSKRAFRRFVVAGQARR